MLAPQQTVEHIVLLNVKPNVDSTKVTTMIDEIKGLASLDLTRHLSAGKLLRCSSTSLNFSHIVHCRFSSTELLQAYNQHPEHLRVAECIQPVIDDFVIVDWISDGGSGPIKPGSIMRVTLLKLKEGLVENEKSKLVEGLKSKFKTSEHISVRETLSHEMAKGYSITMSAVFDYVEAVDSDAKLADLRESIMKDFLESQIVVDYVVPLS